MTQASKQWEILGFDTRRIGSTFVAAWRDFLWGDDSPLRTRLDEVVHLQGEDGDCYLQSGTETTAPAADACEGLLLPESLVLGKTLSVPLAAETELHAVMAMEIAANSPFPADDTAAGWKLVGRSESSLTVQMSIVSLSAVMAYLGARYGIHDRRAREVWASSASGPVALAGFGEHRRTRHYRQRLIRVAGLVLLSALLVLLISALAAGGSYLQYQRLEEQVAVAERDSRAATEIKAELQAANQTINAVNDIVSRYPSPHLEVARLTRLLGDDVHVTQFSMRGRELKLRGRAADAASVMELLTDEPAYASVTAPQAIVTVPGGLEQFYLNIGMAEPGATQ